MSTDYSIFMCCKGPVAEKVRWFNSVDGVSIDSNGTARIAGLDDVRILGLDERNRMIMMEDYGSYGIDVNWEIMGTLSDANEILDVIQRLYRCFAAIANAYPNENCSLMRNGESFLAMNTSSQLLISPTYLKAIPVIQSLFVKSWQLSAMDY
jgi:hypothetical protein